MQLFDFGKQRNDVALVGFRHGYLHCRGINRFCSRRANKVVDRGSDTLRCREVRIAQRKPDLTEPVQRKFDFALDDRAVGDAADGRNAAHDLGGVAFSLEAADGE